MHDECRGLEVVCVDRVVDLGHAHLLDHARSKILVVQRIGHVVVNDGLVGAHTATERVLDVDGLRGCRDGGGGEVTTVLQGPRQELALVAGQSGQRNVLGLGQLGVALSLGQVVRDDRLRELGALAPRVHEDATAIGDDAVNVAVLDAVGLHGKGTHRVTDEEALLTRILTLGNPHQLMDIGNETVPVVDVSARHGILDIRSGTTTMPTMIKTVDGVPSIIETLGDVVITPLMLSSTMNDHNNTLGIGNSILLGEDLGAILVSRRHVPRRNSDLRSSNS